MRSLLWRDHTQTTNWETQPGAIWQCPEPPGTAPAPAVTQEMQNSGPRADGAAPFPAEQQSDSSGNHGTWAIFNRTQGRMPKNFCFFPNPVQLLWIISYSISLSAHSVCPYKSRNCSTPWLQCAQRISKGLYGVLSKIFLKFSFKDTSALLYKAWDYWRLPIIHRHLSQKV